MTDLADTVTPKNRRSIPSDCDREPIHMPGTIQSHGVLLVLQEPDLKIVQVSANAESLLSISPKELLLSPLRLFLADECAHLFSVENLEANSSLRGLAPLAITTQFGLQRTRWDGLLHRSQGLLLL